MDLSLTGFKDNLKQPSQVYRDLEQMGKIYMQLI
jgi:hypothetical protein